MTGEQMPPCGVPSSVGCKTCFSMKPALSHFLKMLFSIGIWVKSHSCEILSKHDLMSPSSIHCGERVLPSALKHCSIASAGDRSFLKPYELGSEVVSAMGSRASK